MYTVASPDPDPNPKGGGQLPNPNECNSTLMSGTRGIYPHCYILMLMSGVIGYELSVGSTVQYINSFSGFSQRVECRRFHVFRRNY